MSLTPEESKPVALGRTQLLIAAASGLILLAGNLIQLRYTLDPGARPDPGERLGASVRIVAVEPRATLGAFVRQTFDPSAIRAIDRRLVAAVIQRRPTPRDMVCNQHRVLSQQGYIVYADTTVQGLKQRRVEMSGALYDGRDGHRVGGFNAGAIGALVALPHTLNSPTDRFVSQTFIPPTPRPRHPYFVRLALREVPDTHGSLGTLLAMDSSRRIPSFRPPIVTLPAGCEGP